MELVSPSTEYASSYLEAVREFQEDHTFPLAERSYDGFSLSDLEANFSHFVEQEKGKALGHNLPEGWVPATVYWLVDEGTYIGRVSIRHMLTEVLRRWGGHIGYQIRPSMRNKGYGTKALALALPKARQIGIDRVFMTCDATNDASRKIIERNGGVFQDRMPNPATGVDKLRFWIDNK